MLWVSKIIDGIAGITSEKQYTKIGITNFHTPFFANWSWLHAINQDANFIKRNNQCK